MVPGAAKLCLNIIPHGIIFPGHDEINTAVFHVHLQHFDLHRVTQPVGVAGVGSRQAVTVFNEFVIIIREAGLTVFNEFVIIIREAGHVDKPFHPVGQFHKHTEGGHAGDHAFIGFPDVVQHVFGFL